MMTNYTEKLQAFDNFLQEWHPDYSGSDAICQFDILEQYLGLLDDEARTQDTMLKSDIEWIESLPHKPEQELIFLREQAFEEALEEWTKEQVSEQVIEFKMNFGIALNKAQ